MLQKNIKPNLFYYISIFLVLGLYFFNIDNCFFWDTVQLGSRHANFYYNNHFSDLLLPASIDSGHIPAFGLYIALMWSAFGKTLIVSHLAMLPFVVGIIWQLIKLSKHYFAKEHAAFVVFLLLLDPTLLSQITLISPDIPLVFFFLLAWNSIISNKKNILAISIFLLFLTSMRGMMVSLCLLAIDVFYNINFKTSYKNLFGSLFKRALIYLPALLLFIAFSTYHYIEKGWIGFHKDSPWADSFKSVDFKGAIVNLGILAWRIIDFGRIGIWLVFLILFIKYRQKIFKDKEIRALAFIFICFVLILPLNMIWAQNLIGHRYLLPIYLTFSILTAKILFSVCASIKLKRTLTFLWVFIILSGNFWVYPDKISQGWDATPAHLPYYKLRKKALEYVEKQKIDINKTASFFPNIATIDDIDLNGDKRRFKNFSYDTEYVFYSNIYNLSNEDYFKITNEYYPLKEFKNLNIYVRIYKRKN